ncbi:MAG: hypothetical protein Kow0010_05720 [Dehalococcoidia bacterium]
MIQATIAIYPLGNEDFRAIHRAIDALRAGGVELDVRAMHTELRGEPNAVFAAIRAAYDAAAAEGGVVMTVSVSNVCPLPGEG